MPRMTIAQLGHVEEMRMRLGLEKDDTSRDTLIEKMRPLDRVALIAGWHLGDPNWAREAALWFRSQGLFLTTDPEAAGVLSEWDIVI